MVGRPSVLYDTRRGHGPWTIYQGDCAQSTCLHYIDHFGLFLVANRLACKLRSTPCLWQGVGCTGKSTVDCGLFCHATRQLTCRRGAHKNRAMLDWGWYQCRSLLDDFLSSPRQVLPLEVRAWCSCTAALAHTFVLWSSRRAQGVSRAQQNSRRVVVTTMTTTDVIVSGCFTSVASLFSTCPSYYWYQHSRRNNSRVASYDSTRSLGACYSSAVMIRGIQAITFVACPVLLELYTWRVYYEYHKYWASQRTRSSDYDEYTCTTSTVW